MTAFSKLCPVLATRATRMAARLAVALAVIAVPAAALAQTTTIIGSLANFDAVNDTEGEKEGFEIQLEGIQVNDITRIFGGSGAQCYIRYCMGSITPYTDAATGKSGVYVRWTANYDAATQQYVVPATSATAGRGTTGTPSRVGMVNPPRLVSGEQCWTFGLAAGYAASGCEHFGISTAFGKNPTNIVYRWLAPDPADPSQLIAATTKVLPPGANAFVYVPAAPVAIPHPVVLPPVVKGGVVQLDVVIPAMPVVPDPPLPGVPPPPFPHRFGKAQWVKVYKTDLGRDADLDELVGGHPNHVIEDAEAAPVETEWKLLQLDATNPDNGSSQLRNTGKHGSGARAVVRRYEFYKYSGPVIAPGTLDGKQGVTYVDDDGEQSSCARVNGECAGPPQVLDPALFQDSDYVDPKTGFHYAEVGDYAGAQMAAQNLVDARIVPAVNWAPASIGYGTALDNAQLNASASATGFPSVPGSFVYTPALGTTLSAGVHTLQVVFTPTDATKFTTQSMTRQITVNKATLTVKANPQSKVYGTPDPAFTFTATGFVNGDTEASALSGALDREIGSNVGKYAINIGTLRTSGNYTGSFTGALLDITPAPLSITANDATKIYGQPTTFAGTEFTANGLQPVGDTMSTVTRTSAGAGAGAAAGVYGIVPSAALGTGLGNYTITYANGTLTVGKAAAKVSAIGYTGTYDGASHGATGGTATGVNGEDLSALLSLGQSFTDAPGGTTTWTFAGDTNYDSASGSVAITIDKAAATVAVTGFTGAYDGAAHGAAGSATGVGGADLSIGLSLGLTFTDVPGGTAHWTFAGGTNYTDQSGDAAITISKAGVTVTTSGGTFDYDGLAHGSTGSASVAGSFTYAYAPGVGAPVNAGVYSVTATFTPASANYDGASATNAITINKAAQTIAFGPLVNHTVGDPAFTVGASATSGLAVSFSAGPAAACTISGNLVTIAASGNCTVTASQGGDANHLAAADVAQTFAINAAAPPPPTGITINPIPNRSDRLGAEVEFRAMVTGVGRGGRFSATGLPNGIRIDDEGEIHGHVGGPAGSNRVTVGFTKNGVTVSTTFMWEVTQPAAGRVGKDDKEDKDGRGDRR
jgi:hypothetical protein